MLALTVALVGPYFVDWTSYRADFEREASAILGRKVTVRGSATATLLPFPSVTFSDVAVGGPAGEAMTIETFSMDAELAPFMRGELLIYDMRMVKPRGVIEIAADGSTDWAVRPSAPFDASRISLEKLTVTEGRIEVRHRLSGRTHLLSEVNAVISAKSLAGPWRFDGALRLDGALTALSGSAGTVDEGGKMRLRLRATPAPLGMVVETEGDVTGTAGRFDYEGVFKIIQERPVSETRSASDGEAGKSPDPGYRLNGRFAVDNSRLALEEVRLQTGPLDNPYTADGSASVDFGSAPRFAVKASGAQIRFDETVSGEGRQLSLQQRIAAVETALLDLPAASIPGTIDVDLPAVVVGDTTIRDVRLSAEPADGGWTLKSAGATLPGRTTLEANGFVSTGDTFRFTGSLLLAVAQPSGFAAWVAKDIDDAIRRLPAAGFNAEVDLTRTRQTFRNLELILGGAKFRGEIDSRQPDGVRPSVLLKLDGDAIDVDGVSAFASLFISDQGVTRFAQSDLDFQVKAGPVKVGGLTAGTLDTQFRLRGGDLEIDRLAIGGLAGASISATGRVKDFPSNPNGNLDASVIAVNLAPLVGLSAKQFPGNAMLHGLNTRVMAHPGLLADSKIDFVASTSANGDGTTSVAVSLQGITGGTSISATLSGSGEASSLLDSRLSATLSARNEDATTLMALAGLPTLPLGLTGAGEATLQMDGVPAKNLKTNFALTGDRFLAAFDGTTSFEPQGPAAKGRLRLDAEDVEPWLMTAGLVLPGMGTGLPVLLAADADFGDGLLVLGKIEGTVDDNTVAGDLNGQMLDGLPHLTGALSLDAFDLQPLVAMLLGEAAASGDRSWSPAPFAPQSSAPLTAAIDLSADTLSLGADVNVYEARLALALEHDEIRVSDLKSKLFGGDVSGLFSLKNNGGTGLLSGQMQLKGADLELSLPGAGLSGTGALSTTLSGSGKSAGAIIAALSGSGTASLGPVRIEGLNGDALPELLARADGLGRDIDAPRTAAFATEIAAKGALESAGAAMAFTIAGGVVRAPSITLQGPAATVTADIRGDTGDETVNIAGTIVYQAGDEALAGSEPALRFLVEGPLGATTRTFDSEPLTQFLTQRALEREQARVEAMQAVLLEKQRLRRETRYYAALQTDRDRIAEEMRQAEEVARLAAEAEAKRQAEEEARRRAEAAAELQQQQEQAAAAETARLEAIEDARAEAQAKIERDRRLAEQAQRKTAEDAARRKAQQDAPKRQAPQKAPPPKAGATANVPSEPETYTIKDVLRSLRGG